MTEVTLWWRLSGDAWEFNHLDGGHSTRYKPECKTPAQKGWDRAEWKKQFAFLNDRHQVVDENGQPIPDLDWISEQERRIAGLLGM